MINYIDFLASAKAPPTPPRLLRRTLTCPSLHFYRACKETRRAKSKAWNTRDLDRARSIPNTISNTPGKVREKRLSSAVQRISSAGATRRKSSLKNLTHTANSDPLKSTTENSCILRGGKVAEKDASVAEAVGEGVVDEKEAELERKREERAAQALAKWVKPLGPWSW